MTRLTIGLLGLATLLAGTALAQSDFRLSHDPIRPIGGEADLSPTAGFREFRLTTLKAVMGGYSEEHVSQAWTLDVLPDGKLLASGSDDASANDSPTAMVFSPDGTQLFVGTNRGAILQFELHPPTETADNGNHDVRFGGHVKGVQPQCDLRCPAPSECTPGYMRGAFCLKPCMKSGDCSEGEFCNGDDGVISHTPYHYCIKRERLR